MSTDISQQKQLLRNAMMQRRKEMPLALREEADRIIAETVLRHPAYRAAKQVFAYVSMPHEVSTRAVMAAALQDGKRLGLPVCSTESHTLTFYRLDALSELKSGAYRIPVPPVSEDRILIPDADTLVLVPMLAFDENGYRLGAGGGYYDRFLAAYPVKTLGICYADCKLTQLPHDAYDRTLACCVTEQKTEDFHVEDQ